MRRLLPATAAMHVIAVSAFSVPARPGLSLAGTLLSSRLSASRRRGPSMASSAPSEFAETTNGPPIGLSNVAAWHRRRRRAILDAHPEIAQLERPDWKGLLLLLSCNAVLYGCVFVASSLSWLGVVALALTAGATASLWQLTMLHEVIHGTMVKSGGAMQTFLLWAMSFPRCVKRRQTQGPKRCVPWCGRVVYRAFSPSTSALLILFCARINCVHANFSVFGYFLYLRFGHLSHHNRIGAHAMEELFSSPNDAFEDGDILFVTHRMKLAGRKGPFPPPALKGKVPDAPVNVAFNFFDKQWRGGQPYRNMLVYSASMLLERLVIVVSDKVLAVTGHNPFFPNKPSSWHAEAANYARLAFAFQALVIFFFGFKAWVLLYLAETAWSLPIHPGTLVLSWQVLARKRVCERAYMRMSNLGSPSLQTLASE